MLSLGCLYLVFISFRQNSNTYSYVLIIGIRVDGIRHGNNNVIFNIKNTIT